MKAKKVMIALLALSVTCGFTLRTENFTNAMITAYAAEDGTSDSEDPPTTGSSDSEDPTNPGISEPSTDNEDPQPSTDNEDPSDDNEDPPQP